MSPSWRETTIGEIVEIFDYRRVPLSSQERQTRQGPYPYYGASGIIDHIDGFLFSGKHLLVAEDGENLNSRKLPVAFFASGEFWVNNHAHIIRAIPDLADDYFIKAWFDQANISGYITGAAQPKLTQENLKRINLALPPLPTQRKIAAILSAYDDLIEVNTRRIALLEEMARGLYREWFVRFRFPGHENMRMVESAAGLAPEGWEAVPLGDLYRTSSGGTPSRKIEEYFGGSINWLKTKEMDDGFVFETEEQITQLGLEKSSAKVFPPNTVVIAMYGATIGKLAILGLPATTNQACCAILQETPTFGHAYAFLYLLDNRSNIVALGQGAAQQNISQDLIKRFEMLRPPDDLMFKFNEQTNPIIEQIRVLQRTNANLRRTRDLLLPRLVAGAVAVHE
jgi:type I restriction enzyme, S subunit